MCSERQRCVSGQFGWACLQHLPRGNVFLLFVRWTNCFRFKTWETCFRFQVINPEYCIHYYPPLFQGGGIKADQLYELHLAEECNLSVDSILFAKVEGMEAFSTVGFHNSFTYSTHQVRKYGNELDGLWVTGSSSKLSCNGGQGRERVKGRRLVVIVRDEVTKGEEIVGCSTKMG